MNIQTSAVSNTFNFRQIKVADMSALLAEYDEGSKPTIAAMFDELTERRAKVQEDGTTQEVDVVVGYRRKPVTVEVQVPILPEGTPGIMQTWITQNVLQFVKSQYVDNFTDVGQHDIEYIAHKAALSGGRTGGLSIDKEVLEAAAASLGKFISSVIGNSALGKKVEQVAKDRFSKSSLTRNIGNFSDDLVSRLQERVQQWAEYISATPEEAENVEDFTAAYQLWDSKLSSHLAAEQVDFSSML